MRTIIKNGELPSVKKVCNVCGCEFLFDYRDVDIDCGTWGTLDNYSVDCPYCGAPQALSIKEINDLNATENDNNKSID